MCILTLLAYLPDDEIKYNIVTETSLIMSVASYFKSGDKTVAQLGAVSIYYQSRNIVFYTDI